MSVKLTTKVEKLLKSIIPSEQKDELLKKWREEYLVEVEKELKKKTEKEPTPYRKYFDEQISQNKYATKKEAITKIRESWNSLSDDEKEKYGLFKKQKSKKAYDFFVEERKINLQTERPEASEKELASIIKTEWNSLSEDVKSQYKEMESLPKKEPFDIFFEEKKEVFYEKNNSLGIDKKDTRLHAMVIWLTFSDEDRKPYFNLPSQKSMEGKNNPSKEKEKEKEKTKEKEKEKRGKKQGENNIKNQILECGENIEAICGLLRQDMINRIIAWKSSDEEQFSIKTLISELEEKYCLPQNHLIGYKKAISKYFNVIVQEIEAQEEEAQEIEAQEEEGEGIDQEIEEQEEEGEGIVQEIEEQEDEGEGIVQEIEEGEGIVQEIEEGEGTFLVKEEEDDEEGGFLVEEQDSSDIDNSVLANQIVEAGNDVPKIYNLLLSQIKEYITNFMKTEQTNNIKTSSLLRFLEENNGLFPQYLNPFQKQFTELICKTVSELSEESEESDDDDDEIERVINDVF